MKDRLVVSTYTSLWREDLEEFCESVAAHGFEAVEVLAAPPHVDLEDVVSAARTLGRAVERSGLRVSSVVPSGVDVNLAGVQAGVRAWSVGQFVAAARLAAVLGAPTVLVHPGRRHPLRPPRAEVLEAWVLDGLRAIATSADADGVEVLLENVPTGLLDSASDCLRIARQVDGVGLCVDVANALMVEDPATALREAAPLLRLVHLSDTRSHQWLHDPLGSGDVDWSAVVAAMGRVGYTGPLVLETLHEQPGAAGFLDDATVLAEACGQRVAVT